MHILLLVYAAGFLITAQARSLAIDCDDDSFYQYETEGDVQDAESGVVTSKCSMHEYNFRTAIGVNKCECKSGYKKQRGTCIPDCSDEMTWSESEKDYVCPAGAKKTSDGSGCECNRGMDFSSGKCQRACSENELFRNGVCGCYFGFNRIGSLGNTCYRSCEYKDMIRDDRGICRCPKDSVLNGGSCKCALGYRIDGRYCVKVCAKNERVSKDGTCECLKGFSRSSTSNACLPACRFPDMIRNKADVCKCPPRARVTSRGCRCRSSQQRLKGGRCQSICGKNEKYNRRTCVCKNRNYKREKKFGNKCLRRCNKLMTRTNSETCQCPGTQLKNEGRALKRSKLARKNCVCEPGYKLTRAGCRPMCSQKETFKSGKCVCKVGYELHQKKCMPVCRDGKLRSRNDTSCRCRDGMTEQSGVCKCESGRVQNAKEWAM